MEENSDASRPTLESVRRRGIFLIAGGVALAALAHGWYFFDFIPAWVVGALLIVGGLGYAMFPAFFRDRPSLYGRR
jgi:hypothetical protein